MDLVIVEHADTGETTLHRAGCRHAERALYSTPVDDSPLIATDNVCRTCHPDAP